MMSSWKCTGKRVGNDQHKIEGVIATSGHGLDQSVQVIIEFFFDFIGASHGRFVGTDDSQLLLVWQSGVKESLGNHLVLWEGSRAWVWLQFLLKNPHQICGIHLLLGHCRRMWNQICVPWGDCPVKWVSLSTAIWIPYLSSSLATSAVLLSGQSACWLLRYLYIPYSK